MLVTNIYENVVKTWLKLCRVVGLSYRGCDVEDFPPNRSDKPLYCRGVQRNIAAASKKQEMSSSSTSETPIRRAIARQRSKTAIALAFFKLPRINPLSVGLVAIGQSGCTAAIKTFYADASCRRVGRALVPPA